MRGFSLTAGLLCVVVDTRLDDFAALPPTRLGERVTTAGGFVEPCSTAWPWAPRTTAFTQVKETLR
jgi:hypothetical protein